MINILYQTSTTLMVLIPKIFDGDVKKFIENKYSILLRMKNIMDIVYKGEEYLIYIDI